MGPEPGFLLLSCDRAEQGVGGATARLRGGRSGCIGRPDSRAGAPLAPLRAVMDAENAKHELVRTIQGFGFAVTGSAA